MTEEQKQFIRDNAGKMSMRAMGKVIGKDIGCVSRFLYKNPELPKYCVEHRFWTKGEVAKLYELVETMDYAEIGTMLNRSAAGVRGKCEQLKLSTRITVYSLEKAARATGYDRRMLSRARNALKQVWLFEPDRGGGEGRYTITEKQLKALTNYLRDH